MLTGYIDPIPDPYHIFNTTNNPDYDDDDDFHTTNSSSVNFNMKSYSGNEWSKTADLCNAKKKKSSWVKEKLVDLDQKAQEDWYAKWVLELVRIVKPGRPVLIENIGFPFCDDFDDYGGVRKEWWRLAVSKYGWDINVDSIVIKNNPSDGRYHVSMRRNVKEI